MSINFHAKNPPIDAGRTPRHGAASAIDRVIILESILELVDHLGMLRFTFRLASAMVKATRQMIDDDIIERFDTK